MVAGIKGIATLHFNGDTRRGPRHAHILKELRKNGCDPTVDRYGNIWVEKGSGKKVILFSSHLDVDPKIRKVTFKVKRSGQETTITGVLDNAVGCYLNLLLAQKGPKKGRAIYVFTASEEVEKDNPRRFARSAREVISELKRRQITPKFCVAIDVTYPKLLQDQRKMNWRRSYEKLFDTEDEMHCYLDGFSRPVVRRLGNMLVKRFNHPKVAARDFHGHDEAFVYDRITPSFAFGPVVFGHFDKPDQTMPLSHMKTALKFLKDV